MDLKPFRSLKNTKLSVSLRKLYLNNNSIISIEPLCESQYDSVDELQLAHNRIVSLWGLDRHPWPSLKILNVSDNLFTSLKPLQHFKMPELNQFVLGTPPTTQTRTAAWSRCAPSAGPPSPRW